MKFNQLADRISRQDFHVHTFLSPCSHEPDWLPREIIRSADELGMSAVALTDHFFQSRPGFCPPPFYSGTDEDSFYRALREKESIDSEVEVLVGCEVDMPRPGVFNVSEEFARNLCPVLVSASHYHLAGIEPPESMNPCAVGRYVLARMQAAVEWPPAQILAHPLTSLGESLGDFRRVLDSIKDEAFLDVLVSAEEKSVAFEIKARDFEESEWKDHNFRFFQLVKKAGCKISPATDAHSHDLFGGTKQILPWAERLGFQAEDVIDPGWLKGVS